jgi:hypothetical protein
MNISLILTFALLSLFSISTHAKHNNLNSRGTPANNNPNNEQKNGISKPCQTYYSANTPHAGLFRLQACLSSPLLNKKH